MTEPNPSFSNSGGRENDPGWYQYPSGQWVYIPYRYVPGQTPYSTDPSTMNLVPANPGLLQDQPSTPGTHTDNTSNDGNPPGGNNYNPILGPNTQNGQQNIGMGGMSAAELENLG